MKKISVSLSEGRAYSINVGVPLRALGRALAPLGLSRSALVVSSAPIARRWAPPLMAGLKAAGFQPHLGLIPPGEAFKNMDTLRRVYGDCLKARLDRRSVLIALGGGVVGDLAGFAAATYMRGLAFIQCPTTLLAMVDASIGGKTGLDLPQGKNLVGAFWQPKLVWMDLAALDTLPDREWRTGLAEVIKYGMIKEPGLITLLEAKDLAGLRKDKPLLERIVAKSAQIKAMVVSRDERETKGLRETLNLGHTFGHAIEAVTGYHDYTHGEAVAVGLCAAARLAAGLKAFKPGDIPRLEALLDRWGLPIRARRKLPRAKIMESMSRDKKTLGGRFRFVIPVGWGKARVVENVPPHLLENVLGQVNL